MTSFLICAAAPAEISARDVFRRSSPSNRLTGPSYSPTPMPWTCPIWRRARDTGEPPSPLAFCPIDRERGVASVMTSSS